MNMTMRNMPQAYHEQTQPLAAADITLERYGYVREGRRGFEFITPQGTATKDIAEAELFYFHDQLQEREIRCEGRKIFQRSRIVASVREIVGPIPTEVLSGPGDVVVIVYPTWPSGEKMKANNALVVIPRGHANAISADVAKAVIISKGNVEGSFKKATTGVIVRERHPARVTRNLAFFYGERRIACTPI
jgi:hypothetical protein